MPSDPPRRHVVVLAPMPLEMSAIVSAFGLARNGETDDAPWTGRIGGSAVTAVHIGMGPPATRQATSRLFDGAHGPVDHVMVAGICGGLDPDLEIGTLINPEFVIDHTSGSRYRHSPPGGTAQLGNLITTEGVILDPEISRGFREDGCLGVDMESAAVAEVCEANGCRWSVYRCISDRIFDGLLDQQVIDLAKPDGSTDIADLEQLIAADPALAGKLEQLGRDATLAARLAAEAAVRGCIALDA